MSSISRLLTESSAGRMVATWNICRMRSSGFVLVIFAAEGGLQELDVSKGRSWQLNYSGAVSKMSRIVHLLDGARLLITEGGFVTMRKVDYKETETKETETLSFKTFNW